VSIESWELQAYASLGAGLAVALYRASNLPGHLSNWLDLAGFAAIGVVVLGLLLAVARYAFMLGKSFNGGISSELRSYTRNIVWGVLSQGIP
jgi:hypothetical protein